MFKKLSIQVLRAAEELFLIAHGWRSLPTEDIHGAYQPPEDYPLKRHTDPYARVHAVNAQRQVYANLTKGRTGE